MTEDTARPAATPLAADPLASPNAQAQAAILLVESLIHGLIARSVISTTDAIEIVQVAADVELDRAAEMGVVNAVPPTVVLLDVISKSLKIDLPD